MMQNNINNNNSETKKINRINNERPVKHYGMPACGGGRLVGNTYVPPVKKSLKVNSAEKTDKNEIAKEDVNCTEDSVVTSEEIVVNDNESKKTSEQHENIKVENTKKEKKPSKIGAWFKKAGKGIVTTFASIETPAARSVRDGDKHSKFPLSRIVLVALMVVLLMFVVIDYVKIFENNQMISELKNQLESYTNEEKKLESELSEHYDIVDIGEYASGELGMVSGENQMKVYVDVSEDESIEGYDVPNEDYGAIATIMNALGQSAKAWLEIFGG